MATRFEKAPYLFLRKKDSVNFEMFVLIYAPSMMIRNTITANDWDTVDGHFKKLTIEIEQRGQSEYIMYKWTFNGEETNDFKKAKVVVKESTGLGRFGQILYDNANTEVVDEECNNAPLNYCIAYDCPYLYLKEKTSNTLKPYVLLPLRSNKIAQDNNPIQGQISCIHDILITIPTKILNDRVEWEGLKINTDNFDYPGTDQGYTEITTNNKSGFKTKIKNKHSDSIPVGSPPKGGCLPKVMFVILISLSLKILFN